jgi:large conductance mechanosensitive channel
MEGARHMLKEFRDFALKGNLIDLAVAFILGLTFAAVVTSFVDDIIMPIVGAVVSDKSVADLTFEIAGVAIRYGSFLTVLLNFLIVAWILFLIVKAANRMKGPQAASTRECPYCISSIPIGATRCPSCTSEVALAT